MPNRTAKFVLAVFASVLAGIPLTTASHSATPAADDCLSAPKDQTPEGSHWYYRIERGTKRHCWYLREEGEKVSQSAPSSAAPSAKPITPKADPAIRGSVANARAELPVTPTPRCGGEQRGHRQPSAPAPNAISPDGQPAPRCTGCQQHSYRWSPRAGPSRQARPRQPVRHRPQPMRTMPTCNPLQRLRAPPPVVLAAADAPTEKSQGRSGSIPMLSVVMIGALSLAGLIGSAIVRFGGRRRRNRSDIAVDRDAIWDAISTEPTSSRRVSGCGCPYATEAGLHLAA